MSLIDINSEEILLLERFTASASEARPLRRAQALLWLIDGDSVEEVADRLRVDRRTIYNWIARFRARPHFALESRLADRVRQGRPRTAHGIIDPLLDRLIDSDPRDYGYRSSIWTAALLRHHLAEHHEIDVCTKSVSLAIARLRIAWKRPRHHLALRDRRWRQAKGGLNVVSVAARGRSS